MELSTKKLNRALTYYIAGNDYQYNPSKYGFDFVSDDKYVYIAVDMVYIIRVPQNVIPEGYKAEIDLHPQLKYDLPLERLIETVATDENCVDVHIKEITTIGIENKRVVKFTDADNKAEIWINAKFFELFYNHPITKYEVPDNITFSATASEKSPVIMWRNDEAIALFLPIKHN